MSSSWHILSYICVKSKRQLTWLKIKNGICNKSYPKPLWNEMEGTVNGTSLTVYAITAI